MGLWDTLLSFLGLKSEFPPPGSDAMSMRAAPAVPQGNVSFASRIEIQYTNFRGEGKTFVANRDTLALRRGHVVVEVEPSGAKIALKRDRIGNRDAVESAIPDAPSAKEASVLRYHRERGTTSELYESLRQKYPDA